MATYGYCRVSTTGQTLATQKALLKAAGVERVFAEKVSGELRAARNWNTRSMRLSLATRWL
jgi:DNA invertase Pin-like site-specific DNA recombinase